MPHDVDELCDYWASHGMPRRLNDRKLVAFLYVLARDHLPLGVIEEIDTAKVRQQGDYSTVDYTNGWLLQWAENLADRLEGTYGET